MTENMKNVRCGCVVLASGSSVRFGKNKLLAVFRNKPLVCHILDTISSAAAGISGGIPTVVVTRWTEVAGLARKAGFAVLLHSRPQVNDTIRLGTQFLTGTISGRPAPDGIMYCVADQPLLRTNTVIRMFNDFALHTASIVRLSAADTEKGFPQFANPVIFPASLFGELEQLPPDGTGRYVIDRHRDIVRTVPAENSFELLDADTAGELARMEMLAETT
jgi:molybdenum cofactor cytidylyltransferase